MNRSIVFEAKNISKERVLDYIIKVKDEFIIPLDRLVDLTDYASKIAKNAFVIFAKDSLTDKDIGLIATYMNDKNKETAFITLISISKNYQGLKIGKKLLELCIEHAYKLKFNLISLEVNTINIQAIKLYSNYSFKISQHTSSEIYIMTKNLFKDIK